VRLPLVALSIAAATATACTPEEPRIQAVSPLADTRDTVGPYSVTVVASGVGDGDTVEVLHRVGAVAPAEAGEYVGVEAREGQRDDLFTASIPGYPAGTLIEYYAVAKRDGVAVMPPTGETWSFRVLALSGFCRADSDCQLGTEICATGTCRVYEGTCVATPDGLACPGGYVCDVDREPDLCVIAPHPCSNDSHCPAVEECDLTRDQCEARVPCDDPTDCDTGYVCNENLGLCFRD